VLARPCVNKSEVRIRQTIEKFVVRRNLLFSCALNLEESRGCGGTRGLSICAIEGKHFFKLQFTEKTMREPIFRPALETLSLRSRRRVSQAAALTLLSLSTSAFAASTTPLQPRESLTEAERSQLIESAVNASAAREATAAERQLLNMTRDEARAMMSKQRAQEKSLSGSPIRVVKSGNKGVAVVGTAFASSSVVTLTKDGKHLHSCGPNEHVHDEATREKIEASARIMKALKGGVRE
jgi:hypothetical protein